MAENQSKSAEVANAVGKIIRQFTQIAVLRPTGPCLPNCGIRSAGH